MTTAFVIGPVAATTVGLSVDHLRRRAAGTVATVAGLLSAALLIGVVALLTGAHARAGDLAIPALVLSLVAGNIAADGLAARAWGPAGRRA